MDFWSPIFLSIQVTIIASISTFIVAVAVAWLMRRRKFKGKNIVETLLLLPLVLPPTVVGFGLLWMFGRDSWIGRLYESIFSSSIVFSFTAAVMAASVVAFPIMYQTIKSGFQSVDAELEDVAKVLGGNKYQIFRYVTIPLARDLLIVGYILGAARALGEFGATLMFAGNIPGVTQTIPTAIYLAVESGQTELALYWVLSMVFLAFFLLLLVQRKRTNK
ncbi:molybdate ABC transporter permease subunit [Texcoconibacillus texcoconensis]|uniref:Molybdenum transport system permease n=1 Tax=Texcoconibacillus texcoconensis TaxID=1095777 RepID=A0A840QPX3_9BACI|nr:molybdate ABC transporter permease subunit [Texcoconibacillus texcoconensis]MBB5173472.1 molybdate transport system permease protein [Texcoconibacillus texcoconensis]